MLHINTGAYYVIGIDAGPETVECVLTDLAGGIFAADVQPAENR